MIVRLKLKAIAGLAKRIEALEGGRRHWLETLKTQLSGLRLEAEQLKDGLVRIRVDELLSRLGHQLDVYLALADALDDENEIVLEEKQVLSGFALAMTDRIGRLKRRLKGRLLFKQVLAV